MERAPAEGPPERSEGHPDLPAEQAYVDYAYVCLDRMRERMEQAGEAGANEFSAAFLDAWRGQRLETFADAERGICFGRLDLDDAVRPLYVGRRWIHDDDHDVVVVNWQAPAARPFYTATPLNPQHVERRRRFRMEGRRVAGISDERFAETEDGAPPAIGDFLLDELERSRERYMRDIVATIQADQYRLITWDLDSVLVVQGGPGTGKTAVGLHRASYLLYTHRERLARDRVLVVGPNRTFIDYISHVLPALGETSVVQRAIDDLVEGVEVEGEDEPAVQRLKGDLRMAEVLRRAVEASFAPPAAALTARVDGLEITVDRDRIARFVADVRGARLSHTAGRERLRMQLLRAFYEQYGRKLGLRATRSFDDVERALQARGHLKRFLDRIWPTLEAERLLGQLLRNRRRLAAAAEDVLEPEEQERLLRRGSRQSASIWTRSDLPLLDELRALIDGLPRPFGHVVVDEAQDLTPMRLRMISQRSSGSLTILGDIAQATGPVPYEQWEEVLAHLDGAAPASTEELLVAYRVPAEIMELALPLLPHIAPRVHAPLAYRPGGDAPAFVRVDNVDLARRAAEEAAILDAREGTAAIIAPTALYGAIRDSLERASIDWHDSPVEELRPSVRLLGARDAKGLEFDHVVVVEPKLIVEEAEGIQGLRHLYVALTRATRTLVVVHAFPLPEPLGGLSGRRRRRPRSAPRRHVSAGASTGSADGLSGAST